MKTAAPIAIPIINPAIETIVAAIPSLLPFFQDIAPKTMPRIPKSGGTKKQISELRQLITQTLLAFDNETISNNLGYFSFA